MTIETRIAKNGSKRYYVRDNNGKLRQISAAEAQRLSAEANVEDAADNKVNAEIDDSVIEAAARNVIETKDATEFEAFLAAANGLSVAELRKKQFDTEIRNAERACKSVISDLENEIDYLKYDNERTNGNLNDFALNFGVDCKEDSEYIKEMVNQIHANDAKIAAAQNQIDTIKAALSADEYATKEAKAESINVENVDETNAEVTTDETNAEVKTDDAEFKRKIEIVGISRRLAELKDENAELCEEIHDARDLGEDERHKALVAELHKNNLTIIALSKALRELEAENTNNDDEPETPDDNGGNKIARFEQGKTYFEIDWSTGGAGKQSVTIERRTAKSVYILGDRYAIREEDGSEYIKFTYDYITTNKFYAKFADKPETPGERIMKQFAELPADNADTCNVARYVIFAHSEGGTANYAIASIDFARAEKALRILKTELPNDEYKFGIDFYPVAFNAAKAIAVYYAAELDGTEDDDDENVFDYLPDVAELNDVDEQSGCEVAAELSKVLGRDTFKFNPEFVDVTLPNGKKIVTTFRSLEITPDWERDFGFVFTDGDNDFAAYNSVGAVARVIEMIDEAVKRGATEFTFPPAESVITFKPSTPNTHDDEFSKKLAELKAAVDENEAKFHVAEQTVRDARIAADEANKVWLDSYDAFAKYGFGRANELHERLIDIPKLHSAIYNAGIAVYGTDGLKKNPFRIKIIFRPEGMNFAIADDGITIAAYSTPDNVERAMKMFADAVNHGDSKFTFPTEDDLNSLGEMHRRIDFADYSTHAAPHNKYRLHIAERRNHAAKI